MVHAICPPRQQTLRAAIAWSYELLDAGEQVLFRRLGVFVGGCTLEAAEVVLADDQLGGDDLTASIPASVVLGGLTSLIDKSLLRHDGHPGRAALRHAGDDPGLCDRVS